jgi:hypothetical protein
VHVLLTLEQLVEGGTIINIKTIILSTLMKFGGLFENQFLECLMCLGANCAKTFQGVKYGVIILMKIK